MDQSVQREEALDSKRSSGHEGGAAGRRPASRAPRAHPDNPITVVLADDHAGVRRSLRLLLDGEAGMEVVAEAGDFEEASEALRVHRPRVAVLDLWISDGAGRATIDEMRAWAPNTRIVVLTMDDSPAFARVLLEAGVAGFVLKDLADSDLPRAIRAAARGGEYVSPRIAARLRAPSRTHSEIGPEKVQDGDRNTA
jgi:two-component system, NarL family, response regulator NreC